MQDTPLKLYDYSKAPSPRRIRMILAEKGIDYENIQIDLRENEQLNSEFAKINPRCTVPALVTHCGSVLTENAGIAAYLEDRYPEPALMGTDAISRGKIAEWNWRCEFEGLAVIADILRNSAPHFKDRAMTGPENIAQIPELVSRGQKRLASFFNTLNTQLNHSKFVAGDVYSIADITATVAIDFARWVKAEPGPEHKALKAWYEQMQSRANYGA